MADLGTIGIAIEVRGREALQQVENDMSNVERSAKSAALSMAVFERAGLKTAETFSYMSQETKEWLRDQKRILDLKEESERIAAEQAKEEAKVTAEIQKQQRLLQTQRSDTAFSLGKQKAEEEARQLAQNTAEMLRLEAMYNKVAVAARVYQQAQDSLSRALELGVIDADQQQAKLEELAIAYQKVGNSADNAQTFINRFGENALVSGRGLNQFGMIAQQVGYQVGDFFVQVQSGTNVLVAFGQQATQLAGLIPGVWGAAIGIGISLTTAIGAAFMRATEDANGLTNVIDEQTAAYDRLVESIKQLRLEKEMARSGAISTEEQRAINELEKLESNRIVLMLRRDEVQRQINENLEISRQGEVDALNAQIAQNEARQEEFRNIIRINRELEAQKFAREVAKKATQGLRDLMAQISQMDLSNPFWKMVDAIKAAVQEAKNLPMSTGTLDWAKNQLGFTLPGAELLPPEPSGTSGSPSPSGMSSTQTTTLENKLEEVYRYLELDQYLIEQEKIAYEQRQDVLRSALENKLITLQEYNELEKAIATQHQQDLVNIEKQSQMARLSDVGNFFGALAQIASAGGKKGAKAYAVFAAVEGTVAAYLAAVKAMAETPTVVGKFAAYASVLAAGLKGVAAIKAAGSSVGAGGGGSVGSSVGVSRGSATVAPTTAAAPTPQTVMIDSIDPDSLYSGQSLINLFDAFYDENDKRGKVFLVAR